MVDKQINKQLISLNPLAKEYKPLSFNPTKGLSLNTCKKAVNKYERINYNILRPNSISLDEDYDFCWAVIHELIIVDSQKYIKAF